MFSGFNKACFFSIKKYVLKKNQFTPFVFFLKPFVGYEYVAFQFLKHDGYAQRLCNQIHNFGSLRKNYKNTTTFENKTNMNKTQNKITCEKI
jgi:hypothetical protein